MDLASCRTHILSSLARDKRYDDARKDIERHATWTMTQMRALLETAAGQHNDLLSRGSKDVKKVAKKAKREAPGRESCLV